MSLLPSRDIPRPVLSIQHVPEGEINGPRTDHHPFAAADTPSFLDLLERAVYEGLDRIVAFPVEDETHYTDVRITLKSTLAPQANDEWSVKLNGVVYAVTANANETLASIARVQTLTEGKACDFCPLMQVPK
mgnify:CR=1 FL=1